MKEQVDDSGKEGDSDLDNEDYKEEETELEELFADTERSIENIGNASNDVTK